MNRDRSESKAWGLSQPKSRYERKEFFLSLQGCVVVLRVGEEADHELPVVG